ncbi:MAG: protease inhibitor I42 family protein [Spirochaetaceae bacterium]|jgi:predicted secreted protein|nr:protease inhibitor I42 family protein [Spirochaetaceae bacterium]
MKKLFVLAAFMCSCAGLRTAPSREYENRLVIELEGNRTTGYSWSYTMEPDGIAREISVKYRGASGPANRAGAGGVFIFTFESIKPGSTELRFSYVRPWESGVEPAKTKSYKLTVDESGKITLSD